MTDYELPIKAVTQTNPGLIHENKEKLAKEKHLPNLLKIVSSDNNLTPSKLSLEWKKLNPEENHIQELQKIARAALLVLRS